MAASDLKTMTKQSLEKNRIFFDLESDVKD